MQLNILQSAENLFIQDKTADICERSSNNFDFRMSYEKHITVL